MALYLRVMRELLEVKDDYTEERSKKLADIHISAMKEHIYSYQYFNLLMDALIRFCSKNLVYRGKVQSHLAENKYQTSKLFKKWLEDSGSPAQMIQSGKWMMWKKQFTNIQNKNYAAILTNLIGKEPYFAKRKELRLERFNRLSDKEEFEIEDSVE